MTAQVQEAKGQLLNLKTSLRAMPRMVQITWVEELKDYSRELHVCRNANKSVMFSLMNFRKLVDS